MFFKKKNFRFFQNYSKTTIDSYLLNMYQMKAYQKTYKHSKFELLKINTKIKKKDIFSVT